MFFSFFRKPTVQLIIDRGRVGCPVRGRDVEIDVCAQCSSVRDINEHAKTPVVSCRPESSATDTGAY